MATISPNALKAILKGKVNAIDISSGEVDNDAILQAFADSIAIASSGNTGFASPIINGAVGDGFIYQHDPSIVLSWNSAPTGTYTATNTSSTATTRFGIRTNGTWYVSGIGIESIPSDAGQWRNNSDENEFLYEARITSSDTGDTNTTGDATDDGNWFTITQESTIYVSSFDTVRDSNLTVEIRDRFVPTNTTGVASFTIFADGDLGGGGGPIP